MSWSALVLSTFALYLCRGEQSAEVASMLQLRRMQKLERASRQPEEGEEGEETDIEEGQEEEAGDSPEYEISKGVVCGGRTLKTIAGVDGTMTDNIDMATAACNANPSCLAVNYKETDESSQWQLKDSDEIDYSSEESVTDEEDEDGAENNNQYACLTKPSAFVEEQSEAAASLAEGEKFEQPDGEGDDEDDEDDEDEEEQEEYSENKGVTCSGNTLKSVEQTDGTMTDNVDKVTALCNEDPRCKSVNYRSNAAPAWQLKDTDELDYSSDEAATFEGEDEETEYVCLVKPSAEEPAIPEEEEEAPEEQEPE